MVGRSEWNVFVFSWWEIGVSSGQKWIRRRASLERTSSEVRFVLINAASESTEIILFTRKPEEEEDIISILDTGRSRIRADGSVRLTRTTLMHRAITKSYLDSLPPWR